jgi:mRNA interferase RelE/StbE
MPYSVKIKRQARQKLKSLSRPDRLRITDAIDELAIDPDSLLLDIVPLEGTDFYRLRVGNWRIIYARFDKLRIISIEKIGARGDVYK